MVKEGKSVHSRCLAPVKNEDGPAGLVKSIVHPISLLEGVRIVGEVVDRLWEVQSWILAFIWRLLEVRLRYPCIAVHEQLGSSRCGILVSQFPKIDSLSAGKVENMTGCSCMGYSSGRNEQSRDAHCGWWWEVNTRNERQHVSIT